MSSAVSAGAGQSTKLPKNSTQNEIKLGGFIIFIIYEKAFGQTSLYFSFSKWTKIKNWKNSTGKTVKRDFG